MTVSPESGRVVGAAGDVVSLVCRASERPSICLWRTPYQAIYTVGGGRVWEEGRLSSDETAGPRECGLVIAGLRPGDAGGWQCEVGAVVRGEFTTTTASVAVVLVERGLETELTGLEGEAAELQCGPGAGLPCRWSTPYGQSFSLVPGDYAERGRLQAGPGCELRVSSLQERDQGSWTCRAGQAGRLTQAETRLAIESENIPALLLLCVQCYPAAPLKLSAPTSILQQADERATLVCHANKESVQNIHGFALGKCVTNNVDT